MSRPGIVGAWPAATAEAATARKAKRGRTPFSRKPLRKRSTAPFDVFINGQPPRDLERVIRTRERPPHVRAGAVVVTEAFLRLLEMAADDVLERCDRHRRV